MADTRAAEAEALYAQILFEQHQREQAVRAERERNYVPPQNGTRLLSTMEMPAPASLLSSSRSSSRARDLRFSRSEKGLPATQVDERERRRQAALAECYRADREQQAAMNAVLQMGRHGQSASLAHSAATSYSSGSAMSIGSSAQSLQSSTQTSSTGGSWMSAVGTGTSLGRSLDHPPRLFLHPTPPVKLRTGPMTKMLTVGLVTTYKAINTWAASSAAAAQFSPSVLAAQDAALSAGLLPIPHDLQEATRQSTLDTVLPVFDNNSGTRDDSENDYIIQPGEVFIDRFIILSVVGRGSFGQVVKAFDKLLQNYVGIKIIKNRPAFSKQGLVEIKILNHIQKHDADGRFCIVKTLSHFIHQNHVCIVFEFLSHSLFDLLSHSKFSGVSLSLVRRFGIQMLRSLYFLRQPEVNVIHCDLKPENILLETARRSSIKLIDFGSSCRAGERVYKYIQSRFYRAPEVIMGLPYSHPIDMWSLGLILCEMLTGEPLFAGTDEVDQLAIISQLKGVPPPHMIQQSPHTRKFFFMDEILDARGHVHLVWKVKGADRHPQRTLHQVVSRRSGTQHHTTTERDYDEFVDLVERMTALDPALRITPEDSFQHPFIRNAQHHSGLLNQE